MVLMKWAQLCTGISKPLLQKTGPIPHLEGKWLQQLQEDLHYIKGEIHLTNVWIPTTQRDNDKWLMDEFLESNLFMNLEIAKINYCRLFLQVTHTSDITSSS
eukprot:6891895-Ditylum_brightwellii.AAC.1